MQWPFSCGGYATVALTKRILVGAYVKWNIGTRFCLSSMETRVFGNTSLVQWENFGSDCFVSLTTRPLWLCPSPGPPDENIAELEILAWPTWAVHSFAYFWEITPHNPSSSNVAMSTLPYKNYFGIPKLSSSLWLSWSFVEYRQIGMLSVVHHVTKSIQCSYLCCGLWVACLTTWKQWVWIELTATWKDMWHWGDGACVLIKLSNKYTSARPS
jgi:hypothetical protein